MKMSKVFWVIFVVPMTLASCAINVPLQREQTAELIKGATIDEVTKMIGQATLQVEHEFEAGGKQYFAKHYQLQTGTTQEWTVICTPICVPMAITIPVTDPYVVIFDADTERLFVWGMVEELSRHPDDGISSMMPELKASYDVAIEQQKAAADAKRNTRRK